MSRFTSAARRPTLLTIAALLAGSAGCAVAVVDKPGPQKVLVCHKGKTLEIAAPALDAHLRHGDRRGPCR